MNKFTSGLALAGQLDAVAGAIVGDRLQNKFQHRDTRAALAAEAQANPETPKNVKSWAWRFMSKIVRESSRRSTLAGLACSFEHIVRRPLGALQLAIIGDLGSRSVRLGSGSTAARKRRGFLPGSRGRSVERVFRFLMGKKCGKDVYKPEGRACFLPR